MNNMNNWRVVCQPVVSNFHCYNNYKGRKVNAEDKICYITV